MIDPTKNPKLFWWQTNSRWIIALIRTVALVALILVLHRWSPIFKSSDSANTSKIASAMVHKEITAVSEKDGAVTTKTKIDAPAYVSVVHYGLGLFYKLSLMGIVVWAFVRTVRDD